MNRTTSGRACLLASCLATAVLLAFPAGAQQPAPSGRIEGTITDSLHARPLAGATVLATRISPAPSEFYSAGTDDRGRFRFDTLAPGHYSVTFVHPVLDSVELVLPAREIELAAGQRADASMATPSSATLRAAACPGLVLPKSTGALLGQVDDAEHDKPLVGADVVIGWNDLTVDRGTLRPIVEPRSAHARTDSTGAFRFCGLPTGTWVLTQVQRDGRVGSTLRLEVPDSVGVAIARLSFSVASARPMSASGDTTAADIAPPPLTGTAVLTGWVRSAAGQPLAEAQVRVVDAAALARTDSTGAFTLSALPAGSQRLEVRHVGYLLSEQLVDLRAGRTTTSDVRLARIVSLDSIRIVARRSRYREFESRRHNGFGTYLSEDQIERRGAFETSDLLRMSGFQIVGTGLDARVVSGRGMTSIMGGRCAANVVIDGMQHQDINLVRPSDIGALEIYKSLGGAPLEYDDRGCGVIIIHTKR